jgi:hypothetical protein
MDINITKITIVCGRGMDKVYLSTDLPQTFYPWRGNASFALDVVAGDGENYCIENFPGVPIEVIPSC